MKDYSVEGALAGALTGAVSGLVVGLCVMFTIMPPPVHVIGPITIIFVHMGLGAYLLGLMGDYIGSLIERRG